MSLRSIFYTVFCLVILSGCGESAPREPRSQEEQKKIDTAIEEIKKEPRVKDLYLEDLYLSLQWNVGVIPGKGSERGYAMYICELLKEHDLSNQVVRIVDILSVIDKGFTPKQASLKRIRCDDYQVWPE